MGVESVGRFDMNRSASVLLLAFVVSTPAWGGVPQQINHQGIIRVNGAPFDGTGLFRFAIVDPDAGTNLWTNDGTETGTAAMPATAVTMTVAEGVFTVLLGDTGLTNMTALPTTVFEDDNVTLRIWFDDGVNGVEQLLPDQPLTTSPYTHRAANGSFPGEIKIWAGPAATVPAGWRVCDGSQLSRTDFAALFDVIGTAWGAGDLATTFNLPDLRGQFLRGVADGSGYDPDRNSRNRHYVDGNVGDQVGSYQNYATARPLSSNFSSSTPGNHAHNMLGSGRTGRDPGTGNYIQGAVNFLAYGAKNTASAGNHSHTITGGGDSESRPYNAYVYYIIRH